jgi:hypothetical protein
MASNSRLIPLRPRRLYQVGGVETHIDVGCFEAKLTLESLPEACVNINIRSADNTHRNLSSALYRCLVSRCIALALCISASMIGPTCRMPSVQVPKRFKEGTDWQRAQEDPHESLLSVW